MLAVLIQEFGAMPVAGEIPVPQPTRGQVLVRVAAAPVNPSDLAFLKGGYASGRGFPLIPGFEGSGTVVAAGSGLVPRLLLGKRVACAANLGGTWAEYVVASATACVPLPRNLSVEQGAAAIVNPMSALAFFEIARREKHDAIVSTAAAGALGRMILKLGLRERIPVIHIVRRQDQVDLLRTLGAQHVLQSNDPDFLNRFGLLSHELHATLILDAVGGSLSGQLIEVSPFGSTLVAYGFLSGEQSAIDSRILARDDKRVIGFFLPNWLKRKHPFSTLKEMRRMRKLLASDLATTVHKRFPLAAIRDALEAARNSTTPGKVLLTMAKPAFE